MEYTVVRICIIFCFVIFGSNNFDFKVRGPVIALLNSEELVILRLRLGMQVVDTGLIQMVDVDLGLIEDIRLRHSPNLRLASTLADGPESLHVSSFGPG